jgi:hypothetical protein
LALPEKIIGQSMRSLVIVLFMLSQAGCTAMLLGGGQADQTQKNCDEYPDQAHCE